MDAPTVRLAMAGGQAERNGTLARPVDSAAPALLVSYVYLDSFDRHRPRYHFRDWAMDSGAFSAHTSGTVIALDAYIACCRERVATDPQLTEVFALDVIGDWRASLKNTAAMWAAGVPAIPCYHHGEPEAVLLGLARDYPKVALGGAVGLAAAYKLQWARQCFARIWPKQIHGFGFGSKTHLLALPWHSVDATNWETGPCRYGNWIRYGKMSVRGSMQNLRGEIEHFLTMEQQARVRWRAQMRQIAATDETPAVRLALAVQRDSQLLRYAGLVRAPEE
jgi:hypothetical protein